MEKWADEVVKVNRVNERIMCVKIIIGCRLFNIVSAYAPHVRKSEEEKDAFWDRLLMVLGEIPEGEAILLGGDLNGHVGAKINGYEAVHGGHGFGTKNMEGDRIWSLVMQWTW